MSEYLSGDQLYRFLHISKRKMKYLLDNGYIPAIDTGKKTYKYKIKRNDAEKFKEKMEKDSNFLIELKGQFSSRTPSPNAASIYVITVDERKEFQAFLTNKWEKYPDALPTKQAASLVGISSKWLNELVRKGILKGTCIGRVQYLSKKQFTKHIAATFRGGELVKEFKLGKA